LLPDFSSWSRAFFSDEFTRDAAAKEKFWKDPKVPELLSKLANALEGASRVEPRRVRPRLPGRG